MGIHYELNCGQYVLHRDGKPVGAPLDEVAIALDKTSGTRHKHGEVKMVASWLADAEESLRAGPHPEMADDLVMIHGRFTLEDLNKMVEISGHAKVLYDQVIAGRASCLDEQGNVVAQQLH
ncbi:hypothetical protein ACOTHJ_15930 [Achromobacter xylosoxidans]